MDRTDCRRTLEMALQWRTSCQYVENTINKVVHQKYGINAVPSKTLKLGNDHVLGGLKHANGSSIPFLRIIDDARDSQ